MTSGTPRAPRSSGDRQALARGAIVLVRLDPAVGSENRKTRPAVVVSNDVACRCDAVVQIVPISTLPERALRPYEARVAPGESGLERPSRAVANQIRTVARERVVERLGSLTDDGMRDVERALLIQLGLGTHSGEQR